LKGQQPKHQPKESRRVTPRVEQQGCSCGNPGCRNGMVAYRNNDSEKGWHSTHRALAPSLVDVASDSEEDRGEAAAWPGDHAFHTWHNLWGWPPNLVIAFRSVYRQLCNADILSVLCAAATREWPELCRVSPTKHLGHLPARKLFGVVSSGPISLSATISGYCARQHRE